ncbi:MAG TPA: hypothetical protein VFB65_21695 [Pyrinomonadaceae bacterium]|nr:hypothetical protein [Pyrinomonadaceae bacterium]
MRTQPHDSLASLNLEVFHLDKFFWRPGWVESPREEWSQIVTELINRDSWIIDGNYRLAESCGHRRLTCSTGTDYQNASHPC